MSRALSVVRALTRPSLQPRSEAIRLVGSGGTESGEIFADNNLTTVKVGKEFQGDSGVKSGYIHAGDNALAGQGTINSVTIGGTMAGDTRNTDAKDSAQISAIGNITLVKIAKSVTGGASQSSGTIFAGMMPAFTSGARRSGTTLESANWPQTLKVPAASVIAG